ncbi:MAG: hypothetical protein JNM62_05575 [Flavobacteriales bacterium]|nr:hypothetical protein [Flavobacteriales bacterium]
MTVAEDSVAMNEAGFPLYRSSANGAHRYRIEGWDLFVELQRIGTRWVVHRVQATAYPEKLRIRDMVDCAHGAYTPATAADWAEAWARVTG